MKKITVRRVVCAPFVFVGVVFLAIGLCIRFGFEDAAGIMQETRNAVVFTSLIRGNK